jgi:predicted XRE-type DNA-binding protein
MKGAIEASTAAAVNMRARFDLMIAIRTEIERWNITQVEAATRLDVSQPRLNDVVRGRVERFSVDALLILASRAGLVVRLEAAPLTVESPKLDTPALTINPEQPRTPGYGTGANTKRNRK